jgi:hypothetical protein
LLVALAQGCIVRVYQPLSGLHDPLVIDPTLPNLADTEITLACPAGGGLTDAEASSLCDNVRALFENQGATVITRDGDAPEPPAAPRTQLSVVLRSRTTNNTKHPLSWALCIVSIGVLPAVVEESFAQEVSIRDARGSLLLTDVLEGRVVERYGFGPWFGNVLLNLTRAKDDRLDQDVASRDLSTDLYGRLSQLVFNARVRAQMHDSALAQAE